MELAVPAWLSWIAIAYIAVAFACAALLAVDLRRHAQMMAVMNAVWPITALYLGPLGVFSYWRLARADGTPRGLAFWQKIVIEATHCGAGCTLGDVISEVGLFLAGITLFGSQLLTSYLGDFALAYAFGIAFQYCAIVPMRGLSFWPGLRAAVEADTVGL